jgi:multicomponent Na+:H+ antiporter subunit B
MTRAGRLIVAALCALLIAPAAAVVMMRIPAFGRHPLPYGDAINRAAVAQRHVTNMVTAVNFDYRAFDTLGEELMLVAAVSGTLVLLRGRRGESVSDRPAQAGERPVCARSEAVTLACRMFLPLIVTFGIYVILHAQLTPGGGFQGGAIVASGTLLLYLGESYGLWRRLMRSAIFDALEATGAIALVLCGLVPMAAGHAFLENVLPLGRTGALVSGGLILIENAAVALAVTAGFVLLLLEFLEETRATREEDGR